MKRFVLQAFPAEPNPYIMKTSPTRILTKSIASIAALYAITAHSAVVFKADNSDDLFNATSWSLGAVPTAGDIATWDATVTSANSELLGADLSWLGLRILNPGGAVTIGGANTLTLGTSGIDMSLASQNLTVSSNVVLGAAQSWNVGAGRTLTDDGVISGGVSLTKTGAGTLSLSGANTYTGATTITRGTELLNFAAVGAPTTNIISASSALAMNGGSLVVQGAVGGASSQAFASTAFTAGLSSITAAPGAGGTATISLGNVTAATLSLVRFGNTGTITVGSIPTGTLGILGTPFVQAAAGTIPTFGYATYGLDDFAAVSSGTIVGLASVAGYQTTYGANFDMTANTTLANGGAQRPANVVRWNTPAATTLTAGTSNLVTFTGALVTPNMGAVNAAFATGAGGVWQVNRQTSPNGAQQAAIWQNNTLGYFNVSIPIVDGREGVSDPTQVVKGGAGTVVLSGASTYTGRTSIYEGALMISADNNLGAATTPLTIAGGTLLSNATFNLATTHAITIGPGGAGGFAATTGNTLTVGSVIGGTTELVVGLGTVAGSGAGTANTTAVLGDGRVDFTAANTFSGGTVINAGSARINGINALGGANYGGLTLNGGKLEYAASLTSGSDLTIGNGVTLDAGGGTIDTNGNNVSYANALRGIGALTKSGAGSLTLNAAAAYAGGTTINGGSLKVLAPVGSATGSGGVTVNSGGTLAGAGTIAGNVAVNTGGTLEPGNGGIGTFNVPALTLGVDSLFNYEFNGTLAGDITNVGVSNGLTINGGKFNLFLEGTANPLNIPGVFNVFSYVGSILGTGPSAFSVVNPASGYNYTFGTSGNFVTLTVATSGLITEWAQPGGGTWNLGINWTNATPDVAGATVNLGSAITAPSTVTLDGSRTVGAIVFNNANAYTVAQGTGGSLNLQASTGSAGLSVNNGAHTIAVPVFLVSPLTAEISTGTSLTLSGAVSGTQVITKRGNGTLALNAANTYSSTILEAGTIELGNSAALGSGTLTVAGNGNLRFGVNSLNVANNIASPVANTLTMDTQSFGVTVSGSISGSGSLTKTGGGTLTLAGTNTYTGVTSVTGGALSVADLQNGGVASSVGQSSSGAENLVINGASLAYTGAGSTTDRLFTIGTASAVIDASGTGPLAFSNTGALVLSGANTARTLFLDGANTGTNILTPTIGNNGTGATSLVKSGDSKWQLAGSNIFTGPTQIVGGILEIGTPLALQNSNLDYNNLGGLLAFGSVTAATFGGITGAQSLALSNNAAGAVALTVGGNNASANYSGGFTGAGGLTKVGTGVLTLGAASSYSGATFINGGAIRASVTDAIPAGSTTAINVGNGVLLGNGVTLSMPVTIATAASEFMDVPDAAAAATFGGTASTVGSTQYRLGISGAGASLTVTGMHTIPGATTIAFITRGNITFAGSGGIALNTANNTFQYIPIRPFCRAAAQCDVERQCIHYFGRHWLWRRCCGWSSDAHDGKQRIYHSAKLRFSRHQLQRPGNHEYEWKFRAHRGFIHEVPSDRRT
jgi:fibronectin-binding autotransporter adhesin